MVLDETTGKIIKVLRSELWIEKKEGEEGDEEAPVPAPQPVANGERILKQVLGSEKLSVYISFDILLIKGDRAAVDPAPSEG